MGATNVDIRQITRVAGDGGNLSYQVDGTTSDGRSLHSSFAGNMFVGPVIAISTADDGETCTLVIDDPRRFGEFATEDWVRRFFTEWRDEDWQPDESGTYRQTG